MFKHEVAKLPFVIRYVPNQYKTQEMCDKAIPENGGMFEPVAKIHPTRLYKYQQICDEAVDNYSHALQFVSNCYMIQNMCDKAVNTYHSKVQFITDCYKNQEICGKAFKKCFFAFTYIPD